MKFRLLPHDPEIGWTPYVWLVYLSFYVVYAWAVDSGPGFLALNVVALVVFLVLYFRGFWLCQYDLVPVLCGIVGLGVVMTPMNPGAGAFFIYASAFLGQVGPPSRGLKALVLIVILVLLETILLDLSFVAWIPAAVFSVVVGAPNIYFAERNRLNRRLIRAQKDVEEMAKIAERERIARDLHDLLGHTLSVVVLKSELAAKMQATNPDVTARELKDIQQITRTALREVREAVQGYRQVGLAEEIEQVKRAAEVADLQLMTQIESIALKPAQERVIAFAMREAVTNVIRHARARCCTISLSRKPSGPVLTVDDDGTWTEGLQMGSGLLGMKERVSALQGVFNIARQGPGTRVRITLPDGGQQA